MFFLCKRKRIVIQIRTNARLSDFLYLPNRNLSVIIFCDYFPWLLSVIIFSSHSTNKPCKEMQRVMLFHYESKQYASISLQNYLTSLFDKQKPVRDYFLLSLQQLVRLLQMCKKFQLFIFWQLTHCHIIFPHAAKYHHVIIYAYSNCIKISSLLFTTVSCVGH